MLRGLPLSIVLLAQFSPPPIATAEEPAPAPSARVDLYGDRLPGGCVARLGTIRYRHDGDVGGGVVGLTDEGRQIVAFSNGKLAWINPETGRRLRALDLEQERSRLLAVSESGDLAVTAHWYYDETQGDERHVLTLIDLATGETRSTIAWWAYELRAPDEAAFSPDDEVLAVSTHGVVTVWDVQSGEKLASQSVPGRDAQSLHMAGDLLLISSYQSGPFLWNWRGQGEVIGVPHPRREGSNARFSPDGKILVTAGQGPLVRLWDVDTVELVDELRVDKEAYVHSAAQLAFSRDGKLLAVPVYQVPPNSPGFIEVWDMETHQRIQTLPGGKNTMALFTPDGRRLITAGRDHDLKVWDLESGQCLGGELIGHTVRPNVVTYTNHGAGLVTSSFQEVAYLWDASTGERLRTIAHNEQRPEGDRQAIRNVAASADGRFLATSGYDDTIRVYDLPTGEERYRLFGHGRLGGRGALRFTPDGNYLASWESNDWWLRVFDLVTGKAVRDQTTPISGMDFVTTHDGGIRLKGNLADMFLAEGRFSPDGQKLIIGMGRKLEVIDVASGEHRQIIHPGDRFFITPDSTQLASFIRSPPGEYKLPSGLTRSRPRKTERVAFCDLGTGRQVKVVDIMPGDGHVIAFSPDGRWMAIVQLRGDLLVYDRSSDELVASVPIEPSAGFAAAFSPDGKYLAVVHNDTTVQIWDWQQFRNADTGSEP